MTAEEVASEQVATETPTEVAPVKKAAMKLSYDDYRTMANLLVCHMRHQEETETGTDSLHFIWRIFIAPAD